MKFYICTICGNEIEMNKDSKQSPVCCGKTMRQLIPGTTDGSVEKHVPYVREFNDPNATDLRVIRVRIGKEAHPMEPMHHIEWIVMETTEVAYRKNAHNAKGAEATFIISKNERPIAVYAYCNLHGLWMCDKVERECTRCTC